MTIKMKLLKKLNYLKYKYKNYSILHCVSSYPAPLNTIKLNSINYLRKITNNSIKIGWSDH